ncbi:S1 family peptidase [Saccharopolyspora sp. CA-218241]|uniref:S1 family peptidase n=1 Tax=Saccharopolyspora sp. CA-218241 TaxID=3240027 RepID=UPI003D95A944
MMVDLPSSGPSGHRSPRGGRHRSWLYGLLGAFALTGALVPTAAADVGAKIIGGDDATEPYPFMVSLQQASNGMHFCGGSLVDDEWVVTAAHCAAGWAPGDITTRIGSADRSSGGTVTGISEIVVHPEYSMSPFHADIAVLKLDRPVEHEPIAIAEEAGPVGTPTRVLGWGMTCEDGAECPAPPERLQQLDTELVTDENCTTDFDGATELCTDSPRENAQACYGDSGGPQLQGRPGQWELIGATSGDGDDDPICATGPGIWTDVTAYADWIEQHVAA